MKKLNLENILEQAEQDLRLPIPFPDETEKKASHGSMWSGDFDSDASKQSWSEFWQIFSIYGPPIAIGRELSTWSGEKKLLDYESPYPVLGPLKLPEHWKVYKITSGMDVENFINGVKRDDKGPYYEETVNGGKLKFYLPSTEFFNTFIGQVYKFESDEGYVYSLALELTTRKKDVSAESSSNESVDNLSMSLKNLNPDGGNGWFFLGPTNFKTGAREYFKEIGGVIIPYNPNVESVQESLKSSKQLFWEKWGVVIQIAGSVVLAFFTGGLTAFIEGVFLTMAEAEAMAAAGTGIFQSAAAWITSSGAFAVARSEVLALALLETAINLPSAFIDRSFDNEFGFVLGIAFCFFPFVSNYGKLGKWIKGSFSQEASHTLALKILNQGWDTFTPPEVIYKFITESLNSEEKLMVSQAMKLLGDNEGAEAFKQSLKEAMKNGAKNKLFPSKLAQLMGGKYGETIRTMVAAFVYFVDVTKWYMILKSLNKQGKSDDEINETLINAQKGVNNINDKFKVANDTSLNLPTTNIIISNYIDSKSDVDGANAIFKLAKKEDESFFTDLVAMKKMEALEKETKDIQKEGKLVDEKILKIKNAYIELNNNLKTKKPIEELYSWFPPDNIKIMEFFAKIDDDAMLDEIKNATTKFPCLVTNFDYDDGLPYSETSGILKFKVKSPITIKYMDLYTKNLKVDDLLYLYYPNYNFKLNDEERGYVGFQCG